MSVRVFISATSEDLKTDCRPTVKRAIDESDAIGVTMESWDVDFEEAEDICRRMIEQESTHFIGIFAYRRGWISARLGKAITEAEFDWACGCKRQMAIFVPNHSTDFAAELRRRAQGQSGDDEQAQQAFLQRVSSMGTFMAFDDLAHLVQKVTRRVTRWTSGGLREEAKRVRAVAAKDSAPVENEIIQLGRFNHVAQFNAGLQVVRANASAEVACFLIHGRAGYGHKEVMKRLRLVYEQNGGEQPRHWPVAIGAQWSGNNLTSLIKRIAAHIEPGRKPGAVSALAADIRGLLETQHLIIEISDLQRYDGSLPAFVSDFWTPLASALNEAPPVNQLIVLLSLEQSLPPEWEPLLFDPAIDDPSDFDPSLVIKLPALEAFTTRELASWIRARIGKDPSRKDAAQNQKDAQRIAEVLMEETGGEPVKLYAKLNDDSTWTKEE